MITRHVLNGAVPVQVAGDPNAPRALIVLQEAFGVNDHIRSLVEMFARDGYYAVAPELFHRTGSPEVPYDDFPSAMTSLATLSYEGLYEDLVATSEFLREAGYPCASIGVVGYCMGGSVAFFAATLGIVGAAASYYGGGVATGRFGLESLLDLAPSLQCPWTGFYGDLDKGIPADQVEALRKATEVTGVATDIIRYENADHGFNCDGRPAVFNEAASKDATSRTLSFFASTLSAK
jgi:carboxymethylenebutenolidase